MTSHLRKSDPIKERFKNTKLEVVVANNLGLQSTNRALVREFKISSSNISSEYFFGEKFRVKFSGYSDDDKTKICRLLASLRYKELQKVLDNKE